MIKKVILSFVLFVSVIISGVMLSACAKDTGYNLSNLEADYTSIAKSYSNIKYDDKFVVDYDAYQNNGTNYFTDQINSAEYTPYNLIKAYYTPLMDNSLVFVDDVIKVCSKNDIGVPKDLKDATKQSLNNLDDAIKNLSQNVDAMANVLSLGEGSGVTSNTHMAILKNVYEAYELVYDKAFALHKNVYDIYTNYAVKNYNVNYSLISLQQFHAGDMTIVLNTKVLAEKVNLTQVYYQMQIKGFNMAKKFTEKQSGTFIEPTVEFDYYIAKVNRLKANFSSSIGDSLNTDSKKSGAYELAVKLYNVHSMWQASEQMFEYATNLFSYADAKAFIATQDTKLVVDIVENHAKIVDDYYSVLDQLLTYMGV